MYQPTFSGSESTLSGGGKSSADLAFPLDLDKDPVDLLHGLQGKANQYYRMNYWSGRQPLRRRTLQSAREGSAGSREEAEL